MPSRAPSMREQRDALTRQLRAEGQSWAEIAARVQADEHVSKLAAMRLACWMDPVGGSPPLERPLARRGHRRGHHQPGHLLLGNLASVRTRAIGQDAMPARPDL